MNAYNQYMYILRSIIYDTVNPIEVRGVVQVFFLFHDKIKVI